MSDFLAKTDSLVTFKNSQGVEARGTLLKLSRATIVLEIYNPYSIVQLSEVLEDIHIRRGDRVIYSGRAVVSNLVNTGLMLITSATLVDEWADLSGLLDDKISVRKEVEGFIFDWTKAQKIRSGYQLAVGELRSFMGQLSRWLEQVDVIAGTASKDSESCVDDEVFKELLLPIQPTLNALFGKFEQEASLVPEDDVNNHKAFVQRDIHPLIMRAPFAFRTFHKPLGYAGDYEIVKMMLGDTRSGGTIYADLINTISLHTGPVEAHRNRIDILHKLLHELVENKCTDGNEINILNIGCGPAEEVTRLIKSQPLVDKCHFTLMDFNQETLDYVESSISKVVRETGRDVNTELIHNSVHNLLKQVAGNKESEDLEKYDFVYCAGLFDYLSDKVCQRLLKLFYMWVKPGGFVLVTNVHPRNPSRWVMEHILEWYLIYRDEQKMSAMFAEPAKKKIYVDSTGINIFLEVYK